MIGGIVRARPVFRRELDRPCLLCWGIVVAAGACLVVAWGCFEQGGGGSASLATRQLFGELLRQNLRSRDDFRRLFFAQSLDGFLDIGYCHHREIVVAENSLLDEPFGQF